jgi:tetratricopeptide (TPR) repeat protein
MRPDSTLWIVPAAGGTARKMQCNTRLMNSWHSFSPNGRWMVFSSKANTPYTQMFLTHVDEDGNDSPPVLIPNSTAANRAVNLPEFVNRPYAELVSVQVKALEHLQHGLRGVQLAKQGKLDEAMAELETAIELQPDYWQGHVNAAVVLIDQGKLDEAMSRLKKVLQANPDRAHAYGSAGVVLARGGKLDEAMDHFRKALELDPGYAEAHSNLASLLQKQGRLEEATAHFFWAMDLRQDNPRAHFELASVLLERQMIDLAIEHLDQALELDPQLLDAHLVLAKTRAAQGNYAAAVAQLEKAAAADPNNLRPVNDLAWLLAVCPQDEVRDGARAVRLAERACRVTGHTNPVLLSTLAAAYAEVGNFPQAIDTATKALDRVIPEDKLLAEGLRRQLQLYRAGKPCRDSQGTPN